jgi:hypothetical protein
MNGRADPAPLFEATKNGRSLELARDPHPDGTGYVSVEAPDLLVLFPKIRGERSNEVVGPATGPAIPPTRIVNVSCAMRSRS